MKLASPSRRARWVAAVAGALAVALPVAFHVEQHYPWDAIPGFYAIYGALGCAALVAASKWLGKALLQRPEDWYGRDDMPGGRER
ncbi:hypothetical protein L6Q96_01210 [Candidatus Binatia bacterium]|nr:hypothetical protein [Candidatus Binatia bacterium]